MGRFLRKLARTVGTGLDALFGFLTILILLAFLSAVPVIHFFSLGYLLLASGRVAESGRFRDGIPGLRKATVVGKFLFALWLFTVPVRLVSSLWTDAHIIAPEGGAGKGPGIALLILAAILVFAMIWAWIRGGKLRHYFWWAPLRFLRWLGVKKQLRMDWAKFNPIRFLPRLVDLFLLGFFGFLGGTVWLIVPVAILFGASQVSNQGISFLISLLGATLLAIVVVLLPFLQTRYAMTRDFQEIRNWRNAVEGFRRAPLSLWIALFITLLFALPLYVLKIELAPREVAWLPNLVFVIFMFPARILMGWAVFRAESKEQSSHWLLIWMGRLALVPAVLIYVAVLWISQYLSWHGSYSLFEQHAFLLPAPMLGL